MTTVFDGTLCAPIALFTIWRTVELFTNAVTLMKTNGTSDTTASATTRTMGRPRRSSFAGLMGISLFLENTLEHLRECGVFLGFGLRQILCGDLAELGEARLADADDVDE